MRSSRSEASEVPAEFTLTPIREAEAREIASWRYSGVFAIYNTPPEQVEEAVRSFLNPDHAYHAVWHAQFGLSGFCCYGIDAQVPGGDYDEEAVDIGLGLRPDLIGRGYGPALLDAAMRHAMGHAGGEETGTTFRATIASFNHRSLRLFARAGFWQEQAFTVLKTCDEGGTIDFLVVVKTTP